MKRIDYRRVWEEAQMDIVALQAEWTKFGTQLAKVQRLHTATYEQVMGEPAPDFGPPQRDIITRRRAS